MHRIEQVVIRINILFSVCLSLLVFSRLALPFLCFVSTQKLRIDGKNMKYIVSFRYLTPFRTFTPLTRPLLKTILSPSHLQLNSKFLWRQQCFSEVGLAVIVQWSSVTHDGILLISFFSLSASLLSVCPQAVLEHIVGDILLQARH